MTVIEVRVAARTPVAEDICLFELTRSDGSALPGFTAGAHIDLHLPGGWVRQYSLCNAPHETHRYQVAVLKAAESRGGSKAVHEALAEGDSLRISEPRNLFALHSAPAPSLLFAGGIGITPLLSMAEALAAAGADFHLHYSARTRERAAFLDRLEAFGKSVSTRFGETGSDPLELIAAAGPDTHLYVCGPTGYMDFILDAARKAGVSEDRLHREFFTPPETDASADESFTVHIRSTGQDIYVEADQNVAQVLEANGVFVPLSCEQGICGTCLTRVLEGVPDHRDHYLTDEEHAANDQFTPCCSRSKTKRLVLDL